MHELHKLRSIYKLIYLCLAMILLIGSFSSIAEAECVETDHGNGWTYVDCGSCAAVWHNNTMVDFGCGGQKPIDPYQKPLTD